MDPFFVEVGVLDLQKLVYSSDNVITTVKMETTELLPHLEDAWASSLGVPNQVNGLGVGRLQIYVPGWKLSPLCGLVEEHSYCQLPMPNVLFPLFWLLCLWLEVVDPWLVPGYELLEKHFQRGRRLGSDWGCLSVILLKKGMASPLIFSHALLVKITITTAYLGKLDSKLNVHGQVI